MTRVRTAWGVALLDYPLPDQADDRRRRWAELVAVSGIWVVTTHPDGTYTARPWLRRQ